MTAVGERPTVPAVLRAVGKASLLALLPAEEARLLAGPVARAEAGVPFSRDEETVAARLLQAVREVLGPPLEQVGVTIPPPPAPVTPRRTRSTRTSTPVVRIVAGPLIAARTPPEIKDVMLSVPGREYSPGRREWLFPATPAAAATLLAALEPYGPLVSTGVRELAADHSGVLAAREVLADDAPEPEYDGAGHVNMKLWTHQRRFVRFGENTDALCFAVTMGGGKTSGAIALANKVQAGRVLIVCPDKVRRVWLREVRDRSSVGWHIEDGSRPKLRGKGRVDLGHPERVARATQVLFDCDCGAPVHSYVINHDALAQSVWQRWVPPEPLDLILYDEVHGLKSPEGKIKRKVKGLSVEELKARAARDLPKWSRSGIAGQWVSFARRRIGLTGTPMGQYPWDIFGIYRALDPGIFGMVWTPFQERYLEMSRDGTHPKRVKPEMMAEFAAKVMSIMYRPVVDLHLPSIVDVRRTTVLEAEARRVYDQLDTELWADLTRMLERQRAARRRLPVVELDPSGDGDGEVELDGAPAELTARNILSRLLRLQQLTGGTLRTDPVEGADGRPVPGPEVRVSRAKAELLAEILEDVGCAVPPAGAPEGVVPEPVVVFARFTPDLTAIREVAEAAGLRYGEISGNRDDGLDADGRLSAGADVVGVQVQAGGTGVDLTRARYGVWYSLGYSVSDYDQARARLHRPGQTRPVVMVHVLVEDTQDEAVYDAIKARRAAVSAVLRAGGVEPDELGVVEPDPGPAVVVESSPDAVATAVRLPWE